MLIYIQIDSSVDTNGRSETQATNHTQDENCVMEVTPQYTKIEEKYFKLYMEHKELKKSHTKLQSDHNKLVTELALLKKSHLQLVNFKKKVVKSGYLKRKKWVRCYCINLHIFGSLSKA